MVGINIGVSLGSILLTIISFYFIYKKKKKQDKSSEQSTPKDTYESSNQPGSEVLNDSTKQHGPDV
jgi:hypothetical protein